MTAVAVQVLGDGSAVVVNCGHPALLVRGGQATELDPPEPAPPLGLEPAPGAAAADPGAGRPDLAVHRWGERGRARGAFFPLQAAAAFALVSDDLEAELESLGPSCNATSLGGSTTTSPCCSSNTAANRAPLCRSQTLAGDAGPTSTAARRQASQPRDRGTSGAVSTTSPSTSASRGRSRISSYRSSSLCDRLKPSLCDRQGQPGKTLGTLVRLIVMQQRIEVAGRRAGSRPGEGAGIGQPQAGLARWAEFESPTSTNYAAAGAVREDARLADPSDLLDGAAHGVLLDATAPPTRRNSRPRFRIARPQAALRQADRRRRRPGRPARPGRTRSYGLIQSGTRQLRCYWYRWIIERG